MEFSKNNAKYIRSLQLKKYRDKFNKFVAEGDKICQEILTNQGLKIQACFISSAWQASHSDLLAPLGALATVVSTAQMKQITALRTPPEVLIVAEKREWQLSELELSGSWSLYLDGIQDPGNLGTILRIADWFGWSAVFCSNDTADLYNSKVVQSTMGAILRVPLIKCTLAELKGSGKLSQSPIYAAAMEGENVFDLREIKPGVLVIGNEGQGIRATTLPLIDQPIHIPGNQPGGAESLNAAVACGILCAVLNQL